MQNIVNTLLTAVKSAFSVTVDSAVSVY